MKTLKSILSKNQNFFNFITHPVMILLWANLLIYGLFIPLLGFYWDELAIQWISQVYGTAGLAKYFSTNRPVWGLFYQLNTALLGKEPWVWQIFIFFWRWICASSLYFLVRQLWKRRREAAFMAAFVFLVYPGFGQQFIATVYGHFFLVLSAFFFSIGLSLHALTNKKYSWFAIIAAVLLSAINLFSMEYFFLLELIRPFFFWVKLSAEITNRKQRFKKVIFFWSPYLFVFFSAVIWRTFIFNFQTENYQPEFINQMLAQPVQGLIHLLGTVIKDLWLTVIAAWANIFHFPGIVTFGKRAWIIYLAVMFAMSLLLFFSYLIYQANHKVNHTDGKRNWAWGSIILGFIAVLLAGVPFWLTGLPVGFYFPNDRFTLPFILGSSLIFTGVLYVLPFKDWIRRSIFVLLITLAAGLQVQHGVAYQRDWETQQRLFWQLVWRIPDMKEGTILFSQELPLQYFSDNSLTAAINWTYDPSPQGDTIPYILYYPTVRIGTVLDPLLKNNQSIDHDLLIGHFYGNTNQSIVLYYNPPGCLRVLDPQVEANNWMVPLDLREAIHLSSTNPIVDGVQSQPPAFLYGLEPAPNWCYYFQKADLARQMRDWETVVELGDIAFALDDHPNDPAERLPFIEGYAHRDHWQRAMQLTVESAEVSPVMNTVLCDLWKRIDTETAESTEKQAVIDQLYQQLECKNP